MNDVKKFKLVRLYMTNIFFHLTKLKQSVMNIIELVTKVMHLSFMTGIIFHRQWPLFKAHVVYQPLRYSGIILCRIIIFIP